MGDDAVAKKSIDAMARAIKELIGDDELHRLVLFLQRTDRGNGNNTLHSEMLKAINVRAKIQLGRKNAMPTPMPGQERDLSAFQRAENVGIRGLSERRAQAEFFYFGKPRHGIESAAAYDSNFCLWQVASSEGLVQFCESKIIQNYGGPVFNDKCLCDVKPATLELDSPYPLCDKSAGNRRHDSARVPPYRL